MPRMRLGRASLRVWREFLLFPNLTAAATALIPISSYCSARLRLLRGRFALVFLALSDITAHDLELGIQQQVIHPLVIHLARAPTPQKFHQSRSKRAFPDSMENRLHGMEFRMRPDFVDTICRSGIRFGTSAPRVGRPRRALASVFRLAVRETSIPKAGANRENTPGRHIIHAWYLAQTLYHRVVVHHDRGLLSPDRWNQRVQRHRQIEFAALPIARQVLCSAFD